MRIWKIIFISVLFVTQVNAEANYWQNIRTLSGKERTKYISELSSEQLILAARQYSQAIEQAVKPEEWDETSAMCLVFFSLHYPLKTNNLETIVPLLNDLEDKSQSKVWRRYIMDMLATWSGKLSYEQSFNAAKIMYKIYSDDAEDLLLKPKAIRESTELLKHAYSMILRSDPNVKQFAELQKMRTKELVGAIQSGKVPLSQQTIEANEKVLAEINKSIMTQLSLFSGQQVDNSLKTQIVVAWGRYREYNLAPPEVSQALANAVNNYKQYDEKLWLTLVRTNIEHFGNQDAGVKLQGMIDEAKDETVKTHLAYFKNELDKHN